MKKFYPDRRSMNILKGVSAVLLILISLGIYFLMGNIKVILVSVIVLSVVFSVFFFYYIPRYFSKLEYTVDDEKITKKSGVFFANTSTVKRDSVQYTTHIRTRFLPGFNFVVFHAFGGNMLLLYLSSDTAEEILRYCTKRGVNNDVS